MNYDELESKTVAELKQQLKEVNLPVSGNKSELIERLMSSDVNQSEDEILEAEIIAEVESITKEGDFDFKEFISKPVWKAVNVGQVIAIGLVLLLVTSVLVLNPALLGRGTPDYELIDYDAQSTEKFASDLVALGHPTWGGRMSGTAEEAAGAQMILDNLSSFGYSTEMYSLPVPMFSINAEPTLRICQPGNTPLVPPCSPLDFGSSQEEFQHQTEYVIQGYSGSSNINFGDNIQITNLGNGSDEGLWQSATGTVGIVTSDGSVDGNTGIYIKAAQNDLAGIIRINNNYNCGKIVLDDCVPIFKSIRVDELKEANSGSMPTDIPFIAVSNNTGNRIIEMAESNSVVEMQFDITNDGELEVKVPCGTLEGKTSEVIIVGAHHDTVYHSPGAVDDTSGTASVLEMARQIAMIANRSEMPEYTLQFCTWGGEEEGLWGSRAWVAQNGPNLAENLRLYINLDMNHVDIDMADRGNSISMFTNNAEDLENIQNIHAKYSEERSDVASKYSVSFSLLDGPRDGPNAMPYNSDHGPFVYDLPNDKTGRAIVCYGSGSYEYHTYADDMTRFNAESLGVSVVVYGSYLNYLAWG